MIVDIRADTSRAASPLDTLVLDPTPAETFVQTSAESLDPDESRPRARWLAPTLAIILCIAWAGGMSWLARAELGALTPVGIVQFVATLLAIPMFVGVIWLLAMRTSRAEARRFARTAAGMRAEAASLERTVAAVSRSIDASRAALGEQVTTLIAIGDAANERLGAIGRGMAHEIGQADDHAQRLAEVAAETQASIGILLASLPRAHGDTAEVGRLLDQTGLAASEHAAALDAQLAALTARGREADQVASGAAQKLAAHITRMEATSETAGARLEAVTEDMSVAVDALLGRTADAVDEARKGIAAQGDAMLAMVGANQSALDAAARDSAEALAERIAIVEQVIERVAMRLEEQRIASDRLVDGIDTGIAGVGQKMDALHLQGVERSQMLAASISALGGSADAMTEALRAGDAMATRTIGTTETLLIALDAAAREIDETLPDAIQRLDERIAGSRRVVGEAKPELLALVTAAESTHDAIEAIAHVISGQRTTLDKLSGTLLQTLTDGRVKADELGHMVDETIGRTHRFAEEAAPRLVDALLRVRDTASAAADRARETLANVIPEAAAAMEQASAAAMQRAVGHALDRLDGKIGDSRRVVAATKPELLALVTAAESTHDAIEAIASVIADQRRTLDQLSGGLLQTLTDGRAKADALGHMVDETIGQTHRFAEEAAPRLVDALLRVRDTATVAADKARDTLATVIPQAADALEAAAADAMRRVTTDTVQRQVQAITDATAAAVDATTRATERLSGQVQAITEQSAIVETRIEDARTEREDADRDTFARRVSLLIESLNSASIDITKSFAPDVTDSAWAAYLKGDRGVFTRRAVRILEPGDAREIARLYDDDAAFRETVNRYIHDFEGMLRAVLAQRDGSPLGVTLLSSDMGKLYVALAQAIERLR